MARHLGYLIEQGPGAVLRECDTATCKHCSKVMFLPPPKDGQVIVRVAPCSVCKGFICSECQAKNECDPWEKKMERMEARDRLLRAIMG